MRFCAVLLAATFPILAADAPMDILEAARKGKTKEIEALLNKGADLEARDRDGRTPLMLAAQAGRIAAVRLLLDKGAKTETRDRRQWDAFMLALLAPSGGVLRTTHGAVLKLLPQPERFRLAITASWSPGIAFFSSCFMRPEEMTQHIRQIHPDGMVIEALQYFAAASGRDLIAFVSADARGTTEISERPTPKEIDAILTLRVEPGVTCVQQVDQLSLLIQATLNKPEDQTPLLEKTFGAGVRTGMRSLAATNPNQHGPLYESWAKSQAGPLYWAVLTALLLR
ncbi:MAG: ankyrin repeat domain-containing protein [Candidatus Solibacter sp.]|nr:ankyrin repeat domain-containing protein [Candidatus Solibacter sp.]